MPISKSLLDLKKHKKNRENWSNETVFRFYKKNKFPHVVGLRNPKLVFDLKLDLYNKSYDWGPNCKLTGNPAVFLHRFY